MPGMLPLTITSPADHQIIDSSTVTVTGTTAAGAQVVVEAVGAAGGAATVRSAVADSAGGWSVTVPTGLGETTITATATLRRSTGYSQVSVDNVELPGTLVLDTADASGDDDGPGTYAYPTNSVFVPGAFDLTHLRVSETGTQVYIQATIRNLVNTFGSPFGAQLLDVYVHDPGVASTSSQSAYSNMNYGIAPSSAWTERLEAQGFVSPIWVDASGTSRGTAQFVVRRRQRHRAR